jgi:hypothetical protein
MRERGVEIGVEIGVEMRWRWVRMIYLEDTCDAPIEN